MFFMEGSFSPAIQSLRNECSFESNSKLGDDALQQRANGPRDVCKSGIFDSLHGSNGIDRRNLDLAVSRSVPVGGRLRVECRVEVFNLTNATPFNAPNTTVGSAAFGTITSAGDPRVVQIATKLIF